MFNDYFEQSTRKVGHGQESQKPANPTVIVEADGTMTVTLRGVTKAPFAYKRPRCPFRHIIRLICRRSRRITRIIAQIIISAGFIASGILVGLNPVGAMLFVTGLCLASCQEDTQTKEEYRQAVIEHFQARGQTPPRWTQGGR